MQSMKRLFHTATKDASLEGKPKKRLRRHIKSTFDKADEQCRVPEKVSSEDEGCVLHEHSRRNGIVFEDITVWSHNVPRSNTLPSRKSRPIKLSDIDFTRPQPEWFASAFVQTVPDQPVHIVDFVDLPEFRAMRDSTMSSLSSFPTKPGLLQQTLFGHIMSSFDILVSRAQDGLRRSWGITRVSLPPHMMSAILFIAASAETLVKTLAAEASEYPITSEIVALFTKVISLIVSITNVVDTLDLLNLITDSQRLQLADQLTGILDMMISAASRFVVDVESALQAIAESLSSPVPESLLPSKFRVYQAIIEYHFQNAINAIVAESQTLKTSIKKVDQLRLTVSRLGKQLDRLAADENVVNNIYRQIIFTIDLKRDMVKTYIAATRATNSKVAYTHFRHANDLAKKVGEDLVQAECLYRMAVILGAQGKSYQRDGPNEFLISARGLNASPAFQAKVNALLTSLRRRSISSILDTAAVITKERDFSRFVEGVEMFVCDLLLKYPAPGIDANTVLQDNFIKGMLRVIRVFHPDKNPGVDEESQWVCEEITKVALIYHSPDLWILNKMIEQYRELLF